MPIDVMTPHEVNVYVEKLQREVKAFMARHDTPRSEARPLQDKYTAVFELKELTA